MSPETEQRIASIMAYELDEPETADPFSRRLARENGWDEPYALRVIHEYKRFLALAVTCEQLSSPSDAVDQAWHLHLQYSARYRELCRTVLEQNLDHGPSHGGTRELARFRDAYAQTLARYVEVFGEPAPSDIWPAASERFAPSHAVRVKRREHWLIRKPRLVRTCEAQLARPLRPLHPLHPLLVAGATTLVLALVASLSTSISGSSYLYGYFALWGACLIAAVLVRRSAEEHAPGEPPSLEPYELLQLSVGPLGALDGAVARLLAEEALEFDPALRQLRVRGPLPATANDLERGVYDEVREARVPSVSALRGKARALTDATARRLVQAGLVAERRFDLACWLSVLAPAFGSARVLSRLGTDKPVGLLLLSCLAGLAATLWLYRRQGRTDRGDAALERARTEHAQTTLDASPSAAIPLSLALFGAAAVTLPATAAWLGWTSSKPYSASVSSGGCGST